MKNRAMIPALLAAGLFCLFSVSNASAGLFGHRAAGCDSGCAAVEPTCGCEAAEPTCGCEVDACCNPCSRPGLLARLRAKCAAKRCCEPTCGCEAAEPTCGCEAAEPTCGCEADACCNPCKRLDSWPACEPSAKAAQAVAVASPLVVAKLLSRPVVAKQMLAAIPAMPRNLGPPASQVRCQALL